jgi:hypothetical protein
MKTRGVQLPRGWHGWMFSKSGKGEVISSCIAALNGLVVEQDDNTQEMKIQQEHVIAGAPRKGRENQYFSGNLNCALVS